MPKYNDFDLDVQNTKATTMMGNKPTFVECESMAPNCSTPHHPSLGGQICGSPKISTDCNIERIRPIIF